ncbi:uncharacterized protein EI90DRAFT_3045076, partial [Cantharellus anzutake]|uniref:uncharacterized protein n=1 Tax=Cantharellus anzutake TaxID=1750568 RepID=UPI001908E01A
EAERPPKKKTRRNTTPEESEESYDEDVDFEVQDDSSAEDSDAEYQAPTKDNNESDRRSTSKSSTSIHRAEDFDSDALDEEDQDIGLDYHANSPAKRKYKSNSGSPDPVTPPKSRVVSKLSSMTPSRRTPAKRGIQQDKTTPVKKRKRVDEDESEGVEDSSDESSNVKVVGKIVQAPTTGRVPPGQISRNTLNFLRNLTNPKCNDREWFKLHDPVFRLAEREWLDFIDSLIAKIIEIDDEIPPLPAKDVVHRIYRDVRFSNDKTPYKTGFSASTSRSGRKGIFAGFKANGESLVAAGLWAPEKNELSTLRHNILTNATPLRDIVSAPEFVELFGEPKPHPKGLRRNVFGGEDELKVAPKGISKSHPDIDLLKLRSVAVVKRWFIDRVMEIIEVMRPLVRCLNDMITIQDNDSD